MRGQLSPGWLQRPVILALSGTAEGELGPSGGGGREQDTAVVKRRAGRPGRACGWADGGDHLGVSSQEGVGTRGETREAASPGPRVGTAAGQGPGLGLSLLDFLISCPLTGSAGALEPSSRGPGLDGPTGSREGAHGVAVGREQLGREQLGTELH